MQLDELSDTNVSPSPVPSTFFAAVPTCRNSSNILMTGQPDRPLVGGLVLISRKDACLLTALVAAWCPHQRRSIGR